MLNGKETSAFNSKFNQILDGQVVSILIIALHDLLALF